jgi:hypothetical protein
MHIHEKQPANNILTTAYRIFLEADGKNNETLWKDNDTWMVQKLMSVSH